MSESPGKLRLGALVALVVGSMIGGGIFSLPQNMAASADVEATIKTVSVDSLSLTLDDGKSYTVPEEFNFDGLQAGVKVIVFYTEVDGKRVIDDLEIVQ